MSLLYTIWISLIQPPPNIFLSVLLHSYLFLKICTIVLVIVSFLEDLIAGSVELITCNLDYVKIILVIRLYYILKYS